MRRKRVISERVIENGDPLAVRKRAREAAKQGVTVSASATSQAVPASAPTGVNKPSQVRFELSDNIDISPHHRLHSEPQL